MGADWFHLTAIPGCSAVSCGLCPVFRVDGVRRFSKVRFVDDCPPASVSSLVTVGESPSLPAPLMRLMALNLMVAPGWATEAGRVTCFLAVWGVHPSVHEAVEGSTPSSVTRMSLQGLPWLAPGVNARSTLVGSLAGSSCSTLSKEGGSGCDHVDPEADSAVPAPAMLEGTTVTEQASPASW